MFEIIKINTRYNVQFGGENISCWMLRKHSADILYAWLCESFPNPTKEQLLENYRKISLFVGVVWEQD